MAHSDHGVPERRLYGHSGFELMQQVTVYIKETDQIGHKPLYLHILELVRAMGAAGATVTRGVAGYSASSRAIHAAGFADVVQQLPLVVTIVDSAAKVDALLPQLEALVEPNGGLITVQDLEGHCHLHPGRARGGEGGRDA